MMARNIRTVAVYKLFRNIKKNTMIMRAAMKSAKFANEPMSNLFTVIFAQTI